ncbi:unnamed protein product, partial [Mesorhabditis spiculigera]
MSMLRALRFLATKAGDAGGPQHVHIGTDRIRVPTATASQEATASDKPDGMPSPPPEGLCCGQGCQKCVWIEYGNELIDYYQEHPDKDAKQRIEHEIKDPVMRAFVMAELKPRL